MERGRRNGGFEFESNGFHGGIGVKSSEIESIVVVSSSNSSPARSFVHPPSPPSPSSTYLNYIEHRVSKMDTLAGIAIKYGVEVADIRRLNGLSTDLQMFAHKILKIPLPGRHPPSHYESNGSDNTREQTPPRRPHEEILDSLSLQSLKLKPPRHQKVSPAMSLLQGYYSLSPPPKPSIKGNETELTLLNLKKTKSLCLDEEPLFLNHSNSEPAPNRHKKTLSLVNGEITEEGSDYDKKIRRRQKADVSPEKLSSSKPKGLPLWPKHSQQNLTAMGGDSLIPDGFLTVRKSSSTSDLQDSDNGYTSSLLSKWSLKPESFALPIFDSIPNPIATWRNKAAKD
ncbi:Peptidoglycan-binding LysM domain-containing protein [Rhynchospora pubera]|uniref:Peptidoglycan-binding LysM domain-containing protein n=1 Tax=Rhynchospora pubera TaxID=906938 RepID=A0AAV8F147_9POAL|nr:Peptidoglycan-binding LysM domain-containing protein [Rhynchospora pubera]